MDADTAPQPSKLLELQEYKAELHVPRAKSPRDFFRNAHPEIGREVSARLAGEGIVDKAAICKAVNEAYTKAFDEHPERLTFIQRSDDDKALKRAERMKLKEARDEVLSALDEDENASSEKRRKYVH